MNPWSKPQAGFSCPATWLGVESCSAPFKCPVDMLICRSLERHDAEHQGHIAVQLHKQQIEANHGCNFWLELSNALCPYRNGNSQTKSGLQWQSV